MDARTHSTPHDAFGLARRTVLAGRRLDMQALAGELGVNRVTLYRWLGSREQVLVDVMWSLTESAIWQAWAELADRPGPRVPETLRRWVHTTETTPGIRRFLQEDGDSAVRLLTLRAGRFQPRLFSLVRGLIAADVDSGRVAAPLPMDELTYTVIRIAQSYLYLPAITGEADTMEQALGVLLAPAP